MAAGRWTRRAAALCALAAPIAGQAQTRPGAEVINVAELRAQLDGQPAVARSNAVRLIVAERLDVVLAPLPPTGGPALPFTLTNTGSGDEDFTLAADRQTVSIAVDVDGDGRFDAAVDRPLTDGRTPSLAPGGSLRLLAIPNDADAVTITARAATGSDVPGTVVASMAGVDAVTGPTGAIARLVLTPSAGDATLTKAQSVVAPDGTARAVAGAIITYTLTARFAAAATDAVVDDPLPAGTSLVDGSLTLDGRVLSDPADADAGEAGPAGICVRLGSPAAGAAHVIRFAVRLP